MRLFGYALVVLALSGCSFLFTSSPPERVTAYTSVDCATSNAAPVADSVLGGLSGVGTVVEANQDYPTEYIAIGVAWTALYLGSAIYGYNTTSDCRDARDKRDWMVEEEQRRRWGPPQQPYPPAHYQPQPSPTPPTSPVPAPQPQAPSRNSLFY